MHAGRADHAQHAEHLAAHLVGRGDHAVIVQHIIAGLFADKDLDAVGIDRLLQQVQDVALLIKALEQFFELVDIRQFGHIHEIGLPREQQIVIRFGRCLSVEGRLRHLNRRLHGLIDLFLHFFQFIQDGGAHIIQFLAGKDLVQIV